MREVKATITIKDEKDKSRQIEFNVSAKSLELDKNSLVLKVGEKETIQLKK